MRSLLHSGMFSTRFLLPIGISNIYFHLSLLLVITSCKTRPETLHQPHSSARIQTVTVTSNVWFTLAHMTVRLWVTLLIGHHHNSVQTLPQLSVHTTVCVFRPGTDYYLRSTSSWKDLGLPQLCCAWLYHFSILSALSLLHCLLVLNKLNWGIASRSLSLQV